MLYKFSFLLLLLILEAFTIKVLLQKIKNNILKAMIFFNNFLIENHPFLKMYSN